MEKTYYLIKPIFPLGCVRVTRGVKSKVTPEEFCEALVRHASGDWGEVCEEVGQENEFSLRHGFTLVSAYRTKSGERFYVITEADRSVMTFLLPLEY